jgi:hypothetical protein
MSEEELSWFAFLAKAIVASPSVDTVQKVKLAAGSGQKAFASKPSVRVVQRVVGRLSSVPSREQKLKKLRLEASRLLKRSDKASRSAGEALVWALS